MWRFAQARTAQKNGTRYHEHKRRTRYHGYHEHHEHAIHVGPNSL